MRKLNDAAVRRAALAFAPDAWYILRVPRSSRPRYADAAVTSAKLVAVLFVIGLLTLLAPGLRGFGIWPRTVPGLVGILLAPLLHANGTHLMANALPLLVLLTLLLGDRHYRPVRTLVMIWLLSGAGTWLIGRGDSVHIGASSIIYGLVTYLVAAAFWLKNWRAALIAVGVVFFYGGIIYGILPRQGPISWEGHLCGALAGLWAARQNHA